MSVKRAIRRWLGIPPDGQALLREARIAYIGEQKVLLFDGFLSLEECAALKQAFEQTDSTIPPPRPSNTVIRKGG